jgi:hypothetical protein
VESIYFPLSSITGWFADINVVETRICKHTFILFQRGKKTIHKIINYFIFKINTAETNQFFYSVS